jgi:hypothetical protein
VLEQRLIIRTSGQAEGRLEQHAREKMKAYRIQYPIFSQPLVVRPTSPGGLNLIIHSQ